MTTFFDCRSIAARYFEWVHEQNKKLSHPPSLATLLYQPGGNPASVQYRDLILKDADRLELSVQSHEAGSEEELLSTIRKLNDDPTVSGTVILYPLNARLKDEDVMDIVSPLKDVEGLHSLNLGYLIKYKIFLSESQQIKCVVPATAKAVIKTLQTYSDIHLKSAFVVIVNNSMRVGKPLGLMLENLGATVIKCYDQTPADVMSACIKRADILITAVPSESFRINTDWIKKDSAVVDVSYQGNVDAEALNGKVKYLTSPTNRIGQVTRSMMFVNLIYCAHYPDLLPQRHRDTKS